MSENPGPVAELGVAEWHMSAHRTLRRPPLPAASAASEWFDAEGTAIACPLGAMEVVAFGREGDPIPESVAVCCGVGRRWLLLNACADAGRDSRLLAAARSGALSGVVLMDLEFRHAAGLLALCEVTTLDVYTTPAVFEGITTSLPSLASPVCGSALHWHLLPIAGDVRSAGFAVPGFGAFQFRAVAVESAPAIGERVAIQVDDAGADRFLLYMPGELPVWVATGNQRSLREAELRL